MLARPLLQECEQSHFTLKTRPLVAIDQAVLRDLWLNIPVVPAKLLPMLLPTTAVAGPLDWKKRLGLPKKVL